MFCVFCGYLKTYILFIIISQQIESRDVHTYHVYILFGFFRCSKTIHIGLLFNESACVATEYCGLSPSERYQCWWWVDGTRPTVEHFPDLYTLWPEPEQCGQRCHKLTYRGKFSDVSCGVAKLFLCEMSKWLYDTCLLLYITY